MSEPLKTNEEKLTAALESVGPELQELLRKAFGRRLEFVIVVYDRGLQNAGGQLPVVYQTFSFSTNEEALKIAAGTLNQELDKPPDPVVH